jgi:hypothetical protein
VGQYHVGGRVDNRNGVGGAIRDMRPSGLLILPRRTEAAADPPRRYLSIVQAMRAPPDIGDGRFPGISDFCLPRLKGAGYAAKIATQLLGTRWEKERYTNADLL